MHYLDLAKEAEPPEDGILQANGVEFGPECRVFEVCNPRKAKTVLEEEALA